YTLSLHDALPIFELPFRVLGTEALRVVEKIPGGDACAPIDVLLHRGAIDQHAKRLLDSRIGEKRMLGLRAGPLAIDLGPGIGAIDLYMLDVAAGRDDDVALAALLQSLKDLVLDLHVPGKVVLAGLDHGARGRDGVAAALHLD